MVGIRRATSARISRGVSGEAKASASSLLQSDGWAITPMLAKKHHANTRVLIPNGFCAFGVCDCIDTSHFTACITHPSRYARALSGHRKLYPARQQGLAKLKLMHQREKKLLQVWFVAVICSNSAQPHVKVLQTDSFGFQLAKTLHEAQR
ncbi:MAG: hypothetical protein HC765_15530 [Brachymonas sp.]|nr:hypothetical protein [Brachymonas sp.]